MSVGEAAAILVSRITEDILEGEHEPQEAAEAERTPEADDATGPENRATTATPTTPDEDDGELVHGVDTPMSPEPVADVASNMAENIEDGGGDDTDSDDEGEWRSLAEEAGLRWPDDMEVNSKLYLQHLDITRV